MPAMASEKSSHHRSAKEPSGKDIQAHWDYLGVENPSHWGMLSPEYRTCEAGNRQSPINITMTHHGEHHQKLKFHYQTSQLHEMNNGHTIQVSHVSGCRVDLNDRNYKLRQFHFHAPSEHHIEGKVFPMEMHLVHQDETGHVLVIAVMMKTDATHPSAQQTLEMAPRTDVERSLYSPRIESDQCTSHQYVITTLTPVHSPHHPAPKGSNGSSSKNPCTSPNTTSINSSKSSAIMLAPFNHFAIVISTTTRQRKMLRLHNGPFTLP